MIFSILSIPLSLYVHESAFNLLEFEIIRNPEKGLRHPDKKIPGRGHFSVKKLYSPANRTLGEVNKSIPTENDS
jgi:hypothetical protein